MDQENVIVVEEGYPDVPEAPKPEPQRGFIAEWAVTIILLLFGTTNLVQAFVIPTGSMEDSLLVGDHLLSISSPFHPPVLFRSISCPIPISNAETSSSSATPWISSRPS